MSVARSGIQSYCTVGNQTVPNSAEIFEIFKCAVHVLVVARHVMVPAPVPVPVDPAWEEFDLRRFFISYST